MPLEGKISGEKGGDATYRTINVYELLGIGPRSRAWFGFWLGVRIEEDIGGDFGVGEGFGDVLGLGEEVRSDMLDTRTVLFRQKDHHTFAWSQLEMGGRHQFPS
jgi:hypothetical protein